MAFRQLKAVWLSCLLALSVSVGAQGQSTSSPADTGSTSGQSGAVSTQGGAGLFSTEPGAAPGGAGLLPTAPGKGDVLPPTIVGKDAGAPAAGQPGAASAKASGATAAAPEVPNDFQRFVLGASGQLLPIYGANFFVSGNGYAPLQGTPVPDDYPLGPGDEVLIRTWGSVDVDYRAMIDRNGLINIPKVGNVSLAGVRAANAEAAVRAAFDKVFRGYSLSVTLGRLRGLTLYVVGQARRPGTYTVSSLSTVVTALFESGGPSGNGSLRHVQVKRGGKLVAELDLYAFLARGDKSADIRLLDGDVIVIPPAYGFVALTGKVTTPAIYELRGPDDSLQSLIEVAGGLPVVADPRLAVVEHVDPTRRQPRSIEQFALDAAGLARTLSNGDLVTVKSITPEFANAVTLRGRVALRAPFREGMKIVDLIPNRGFLVSNDTLWRQNGALKQGGDYLAGIGHQYEEINWDYAVVERRQRVSLAETLIPFNLGRALADSDSPDNVLLQAGDTVTVFSADDVRIPIAKRKVLVRLEGEIRRPGVYQVEPGETLVNMLEKAGGLTPDAYLFGTEFYRESVRRSQQESMEKFIRRLEQRGTSDVARLAANASTSDPQSAAAMQARLAAETESRNKFVQRLRELKSSGRVTMGLAAKDASFAQLPAFRLENGDRLVLTSRPDFVQVVGSVNTESALLWQPGRSVTDYLAQAGVSKEGDKSETFVIRADGTVASNSDRWLSSVAGIEVMPGDVIVVPEKLDKETAWTALVRNAKDVTQILANFGLGAAAIRTLGK